MYDDLPERLVVVFFGGNKFVRVVAEGDCEFLPMCDLSEDDNLSLLTHYLAGRYDVVDNRKTILSEVILPMGTFILNDYIRVNAVIAFAQVKSRYYSFDSGHWATVESVIRDPGRYAFGASLLVHHAATYAAMLTQSLEPLSHRCSF